MDEPKYTMTDFCCERYTITDLRYYELLDEIDNPRQGRLFDDSFPYLLVE
jgi:hypothetical protein